MQPRGKIPMLCSFPSTKPTTRARSLLKDGNVNKSPIINLSPMLEGSKYTIKNDFEKESQLSLGPKLLPRSLSQPLRYNKRESSKQTKRNLSSPFNLGTVETGSTGSIPNDKIERQFAAPLQHQIQCHMKNLHQNGQFPLPMMETKEKRPNGEDLTGPSFRFLTRPTFFQVYN